MKVQLGYALAWKNLEFQGLKSYIARPVLIEVRYQDILDKSEIPG
jgi:hypothetical protein